MTAVPGSKSFFGFSEKKFSARVGDATNRKRVSGVEAAPDGRNGDRVREM
jgi:hypothetical protein